MWRLYVGCVYVQITCRLELSLGVRSVFSHSPLGCTLIIFAYIRNVHSPISKITTHSIRGPERRHQCFVIGPRLYPCSFLDRSDPNLSMDEETTSKPWCLPLLPCVLFRFGSRKRYSLTHKSKVWRKHFTLGTQLFAFVYLFNLLFIQDLTSVGISVQSLGVP